MAKVKFDKTDDDKQRIVSIVAFVFFIFMMCYNLTHSALWGDEWVEYTYSQRSISNGELYNSIISTFQPPLYNFVMHFWLKLNQSVLWFRFFNVLLGAASGIFLFKTIEKIYNRKTASTVLVFLGACYQWIYCIQECSEYALMLTCLFGMLYFYVLTMEQFKYRRMVAFILFAVLAIYSQYGSAFVAVPLLCIFFVSKIFDKGTERKQKMIIVSSYLFSLLTFAVPLYSLFLKQQLEHNKISEYTVEFSVELLQDFPFTLGKIIGYLFNLGTGDAWNTLMSIVGFILIVISIYLVIKGNMDWLKKSLVITLWFGYILHYFLVQLHIYAMIHPNDSRGFLSRYSYFYIPLLALVLPIIIKEFYSLKKSADVLLSKYFLTAFLGIVLCLSGGFVLENWNKAYDDQFAEIWMENEGWNDTTYLYGVAYYGFEYYVSHSIGYQDGYLDNAIREVDNDNLPSRFWAWRTNWNGDGWQATIDAAKAQGYTVIIYQDSGDAGQLAFCSCDEMR